MPLGAVRVLMYSHDTFGLGHLTRTLRIAGALRALSDRVSALVLTGSPVAPYVSLPAGADFIKLPSTIKVASERYESRDLALTFSQVKKLRARMIRTAAQSFRPHVFMVDNVPLGMKGEVVPTLRWLRQERPDTRIILNLRDILDDPETIRTAWERDGVDEVLASCYDRIYILGDPSVYDAIEAYGLPPEISRHLGYASPTFSGSLPRERLPGADGRPLRVLFTVGGGGDGVEILQVGLEALKRRCLRIPGDGARPLELELVTGPLMASRIRRDLLARAESLGVRVLEFAPDLPQRMARADLVVAMAGYNTCCEIFRCARRALVIPRVMPRTEQLLRARALEARGLASVLPPTELTPARMRAAFSRALFERPPIVYGRLPDTGGLRNLARDLENILPARARRMLLLNGSAKKEGPGRRRTLSLAGGDAPQKQLAASAVSRRSRASGDAGDSGVGGVSRDDVWFWPGAIAAKGAPWHDTAP